MGVWRLAVAGAALRFAPVLCLGNSGVEDLVQRLKRKENAAVSFDDEVCEDLPEPVFRLSPEYRKTLDVGKKAKCVLFHRVGEEVFKSEFSGRKSGVGKWSHTFTCPVTLVTTEEELHRVFESRKPDCYLDSLVVAYIPLANPSKLRLFQELATRTYTDDTTSHVLLTEGKAHLRFVAVTDKHLAERLQLTAESTLGEQENDLIVYRYYHPETPLERFQPADFRPMEQILGQTKGYLKYHFEYPAGIRQLRLKLMRKKYVLKRSQGKLDYSSMRKAFVPYVTESLSDLSTAVSQVSPLLRPLVSLKDMSMILFPTLVELMRTKKPVLVLSAKESDPVQSAAKVGLRTVAERFAEKVVTVVTTPRVFSHSHIKNVQLRHQSDLELRLYVLSTADYPTVSHQYRCPLSLQSASPEAVAAWVQSCLDGKEQPFWECEEVKAKPQVLCRENVTEVLASGDAWVWVGDAVPQSFASLRNIYLLPMNVELPTLKMSPGLYRVFQGKVTPMPGFRP